MSCATTQRAIETLIAPLCLGRDPRDIAGLMADMFRRLHIYGRSGPVLYGLSGVDIALWDIAGKLASQPIHRLLAANAAPELPVYASLLRYGEPSAVARASERAISQGFSAIKLHEIGAAETAAARDAIGNSVPLMIDMNCALSCEDAIVTAKALEPHGLAWWEEPIWPPDDFSAMARLGERTTIKLAAGENCGSLEEFERLIDFGKIKILQPSVTKIGGISEMLRITALARSRGVTVAPHSPYFGPGLAATAHLCAALMPERLLEWYFCDVDARPFGGEIDGRGGHIMVPQGPGLGVGPDHDALSWPRSVTPNNSTTMSEIFPRK